MARFEYQTTPELKERLRAYAESHGKSMSEVLDELLRAHLETEAGDGVDTEAEDVHVGHEYDQTAEKLQATQGKIEKVGSKERRLAQIATILFRTKPYSDLYDEEKPGGNWDQIRFQAVKDFGKGPDWARKLQETYDVWITDPRDIDLACIQAKTLLALHMKKKHLRKRLDELRVKLAAEQPRIAEPVAPTTPLSFG
jgi:plasmid stability protein